MQRSPAVDEFQGTERFELERCLGVGSFGVVYRAYDRERRTRVALKTLKKAYAGTLYRFKQEFRSLADMSHPNLVTLFELMNDGDHWFFTMELVEGVSFLKYMQYRRKPLPSTVQASVDRTSLLASANNPPLVRDLDVPFERAHLPPCRIDIDKLRSVLRQLTEGISTLHQAGKLHRDIKPSNVLVTRDGRVVLLDFGLVAELKSDELSRNQNLVGTPEYMSPEQGSGSPVTEASDWYSVGTIMFQALTGELPFQGKGVEALINKQKQDPPRPSELVTGVPPDLDQLCLELLARDPAERPNGAEVLRRLGMPTMALETERKTKGETELVGRRFHLNFLRNAYMRMKTRNRPVTLYVHGQSGIGKSAVIQRFVEELESQERDVLVFSGRCFDRESVPFKALDGLIDVMSRYLRRLSDEEARPLFGPSILSLAQLFPVLLQVPAIVQLQGQEESVSDPQESRRLAFFALRHLISRLSERNPLVLVIDNLQWGDLDSLDLLAEILRPPRPPSILLVACYRSEDLDSSTLLQNLLPLRIDADPSVDVQELTVGDLLPNEAKSMAMALLGADDPAAEPKAEAIVREAGGNPLFIKEFVEFTRMRGEVQELLDPHTGALSLSSVIAARIEFLPPDARTLLEVVALYGQPITLELAKRASQLRDEYMSMAELRSRLLLRTHKSHDLVELETYNNRIRETAVSLITDENRRAYHLRLADALAETDESPELLMQHYSAAGHAERTVQFALKAADNAKEGMAFERAARLYQVALAHTPDVDPEKWRLWLDLANANANSGRTEAAAEAFVAASALTDGPQALELKRKGAEHFLRCGKVSMGLTLVREIAEILELPISFSHGTLRWWRAWQWLRRPLHRTRFSLVDEAQVPEYERTRIDLEWSLATFLGYLNPLLGHVYQVRHLHRALKAGEPFRVLRALGMEAVYSEMRHQRHAKRAFKLMQLTEMLAEEINNPLALGWLKLSGALCAFEGERWKQAVRHAQFADQIFRERCAGADWEKDVAVAVMLRSLQTLGELKDLLTLWPDALNGPRLRRDNLGLALLLSHCGAAVGLAKDTPDEAATQLANVLSGLEMENAHSLHAGLLAGQAEVEIYRGDTKRAWEISEKAFHVFASTGLSLVRSLRVDLPDIHARAALAETLGNPGGRSQRIAVVNEMIRLLERERSTRSLGLAHARRAAILSLKGHVEPAKSLLARAEMEFQAADMTAMDNACKLIRGELTGGDHGRFLVSTAARAMSAQEIVDPFRYAATMIPGFFECAPAVGDSAPTDEETNR
ncbi:MAG: protein kinase [Myxococcales bacterium]|nr:protein kinase [Myxococcales bacterium]